MNQSYFRIKLARDEALERLCVWNKRPIREEIEVEYAKAVSVAVDENGLWKGACLYVYENAGWTVFEELSGYHSFVDAEDWKAFAGDDSLVVAGYDEALLSAEFVVIENGTVVKNFTEIEDTPEKNVNQGTGFDEISSWVDVASFVDDDDLAYSGDGAVVIL